jgi:hypothetical protein
MARNGMPPQQERYRNPGLRAAPDGHTSRSAHHPNDVPSHISFPTHPPPPDRKLGLMATIGKTRFLVLMMMVLPLALGTWVVFNSRLYDVSFVFDKDGRVKIKRKTLAGGAPTVLQPAAPPSHTPTRVMAAERSGRHIKLKPSSNQQGIRVSGGGGARRERRPQKPIPARKKQVALVAAPERKVVNTPGPSQGGLLGIFTGIRFKKTESPEAQVGVVELRLGVRKQSKSKATRGVKMRQTSVRTKRKEEWNLIRKQEAADRKFAIQQEKLDKKTAKIAAKKAKIDEKRAKADTRQYELDRLWQTKEDARIAKSSNRAETSIGRAIQKKVQIEYRLWHEKRNEQKAHRCSEFVDEAREAEGIWRSIRVRRRSAAERACLADKKSFLRPLATDVTETVTSWFKAIRLRRRPKQQQSPPAEMVVSAPKQNTYKKGAPPRRYASPTTEVALSPSFSPDDSFEPITMVDYLASLGFSGNKRSRRNAPLEDEKKDPDSVLGYFSSSSRPKKSKPAIRVRRKRRY